MSKEKAKTSVGQKIVNIIGIILCVIFIPIIIINVTLIIKTYTNPDKIASVFGVSPVICLTGSMEDEFYAGDMIFIKETNPDTLQVGDVICFISNNTEVAVTHRIIDIQTRNGERLFVTKGDNNNVEDRIPVKTAEIQGKYMNVHIANLGNIAMFMQTTIGMIIFVVCPLLLFILWDLLRRAVSSRKNKKDSAHLEEEIERLKAQVGGTGVQQDYTNVQQQAPPENLSQNDNTPEQ